MWLVRLFERSMLSLKNFMSAEIFITGRHLARLITFQRMEISL